MSTFPGRLPSWLGNLHSIYHASSSSAPTHLIFFIPGNPGLISYYDSFLRRLADDIPGASVLGVDHAGFSSAEKGRIYTLDEQVKGKREVLEALWKWEETRWRRSGDSPADVDSGYVSTSSTSGIAVAGGDPAEEQSIRNRIHPTTTGFNPHVVILGHSMGSWLLLELLSSLSRNPSEIIRSPPSLAIHLTPTILSIALSAQGKVLTPIITSPIGYPIAQLVVGAVAQSARWIPGMTAAMAWASGNTREHVEATLRPWVVRQMVALASEEMVRIREERWGFEDAAGEKKKKKDEVAVSLRESGTKMVWYFAERDGWVPDGIADRIEGWKVGRVVRDRTGVVHAFSLRHTDVVADVVRGIVEEEIGV